MSLSLNNSTIVPLLSGDTFIGQNYDNILDFAEIDISIKCDTGYTLTYIYSQDKLNIDYQVSNTITAQVDTQFYKIPVNDRYFKLKIEATDGDMSVLNVQTIYKSSTTYTSGGSGPSSNVAITGPLNGDGSVKVGGSLTLGGSVDTNLVNIDNKYLDNGALKVAVENYPNVYIVGVSNDGNGNLDVNLNATKYDNGNGQLKCDVSGESVSVSNLMDLSGVRVDISGESVSVSNLLDLSGVRVDISGESVLISNLLDLSGVRVDISGESVSVSNLMDLSGVYVNNAQLNKLSFDINSDLNVNLNNVNSNFIQNNGLKTYVVNSSLAITNSALSNMAFNSGSLKVNDTQNSYTSGALNVSDDTTHTTLTSIYNCVNTRGSGVFNSGSIVSGGNTSVIDLSTLPVKTLTIYGITSDATTLTVMFSYDGSSFFRSQYSYNISSSSGDNFGFALNACPKYICLQSSSSLTTLQAYLDYS